MIEEKILDYCKTMMGDEKFQSAFKEIMSPLVRAIFNQIYPYVYFVLLLILMCFFLLLSIFILILRRKNIF
jgi:hypothetical protein